MNFHNDYLNMAQNTYDKFKPNNTFSVRENEVRFRAAHNFNFDLNNVVCIMNNFCEQSRK